MCIAALAFAFGATAALGARVASVGVSSLALAVIFGGMHQSPHQALINTAWVTFGALVQAVAWLILWRSERTAYVRRALAAKVRAEGGIAATLLTGMTASIPEPDRVAFRDSGLAHLLAVAGLHIGIVMGLVLGFARLVLALSERATLFWPCKQLAALAALAAGGGYMELTGVHLPILRSFAMACLFTLAVVAMTGHFTGGIVLILILSYIACFASCIGPVFWTLVPEIFPNRVRSEAMIVPVMVQWIANAIAVLPAERSEIAAGEEVDMHFIRGGL